MGIDFIRKAAPSYRKGLDRKRIELCTPDLFTRQPDTGPRAYAARVRGGQTLKAGEKLGIHLEGDEVFVIITLTQSSGMISEYGSAFS